MGGVKFHIHRDPDWQDTGIFRLYECRCGAKRVRRVSLRMYGPIPAGWPSLLDRHGRSVEDSGWVKP